MIEHCVFIRFQDDVLPEKCLQLVQAFEDLQGQMDGLVSISAGHNTPFEAKSHGFEYGFIARFTSNKALLAYQADPRHQVLGAALVAHAPGGLDGIFVVDLAHS